MSRRVSLEIIGCTGQALTRLRHISASADGALFVQVATDPSLGLAIRSEAFVCEPSVDRGLGPRGRVSACRDHQRLPHAAAESLEREVPVAHLRALVGDRDPNGWPELLEQSGSLRVRRRRGGRDVPRQDHFGIRGIRVLAAWSSTAGETPSELAGWNPQRPRHDEIRARRELRSLQPGASLALGSKWR